MSMTLSPSTTAGRRLIPTLFGILLLIFPAATLVVPRGGNVVMFTLVALSLVTIAVVPRTQTDGNGTQSCRPLLALSAALLLPLVAVLISELTHGNVVGNTLDSPSRFALAIPVIFAVRRVAREIPAWFTFGLPIGAFAAALMASYVVVESLGRAESTFLNPIHFGDIALLLGILSVLSTHWIQRNNRLGIAIKLAGFVAGGYASWASQSRGGWIALPAIAVACFWLGHQTFSRRARLAAVVMLIAAVAMPMALSDTVRTRLFTDVASDLTKLKQGHPDTSIGIRLELYKAAGMLIERAPVFGLGAHGFHDAMDQLAKDDVISPAAAELGRGEVHNQILAYATDYGLLGTLAMFGIYLVPAWFFLACLGQSASSARRAAVLGLLSAIAFLVFGLTVETFNLKVTTSFYATILAIFAAFAYAAPANGDASRQSTHR